MKIYMPSVKKVQKKKPNTFNLKDNLGLVVKAAIALAFVVFVWQVQERSTSSEAAPLPVGSVITNQATATFQDALGISYGPVSSNVASVTIVSASGATFIIRHTQESLSTFGGAVQLRVYTAGTSNLVHTIDIIVDNSGQSSAIENPSQLINGNNYDLVLKVPRYLTKKMTNVQWPPSITLNFGQTLAGDLDDNDVINTLDWSTMNSSWRTSNATADINKDAIVNTADWGVMNKNWGLTGEE